MDQDRRWMGVGRSTITDSRAAGVEAANRAMRRDDPKLLLVFAGIDHDPVSLLAGIKQVAPGVPLIGCSTHGEIGPDGPLDGSVVVTALGGPGFSVSTARSDQISGRQREAGAEIAACASEVEDLPYKALLLFTDGLARDQEAVLRGAYGVVGASVPLFGGAAGDGWQMSGTFQLFGDEVMRNGVVGATLASDAPLAIATSHGWHTTGEPMIVTDSGEGRVYKLDDEPALDKYLSRLGAPAEIYDDRKALTSFLLPRPLGVERRSGIEVRNISTEVDIEGRTIGGGGALALGSLTWAMEGDSESILGSVENSCQEAVAGLADHPPIGLLTLSCAASRAVLGDEGIQREGIILAGQAKGTPFAGFYTYGEIARTRGIDGFHNQTLVVLAVS
jgi:hypothetical protein